MPTHLHNFADIKAHVGIDTVLATYGISLKSAGAKLVGACPIHNGLNKRAFTVSADRRAWHCFGNCSTGGSVLDLVAALEKCSLIEAAKILTERHGL